MIDPECGGCYKEIALVERGALQGHSSEFLEIRRIP